MMRRPAASARPAPPRPQTRAASTSAAKPTTPAPQQQQAYPPAAPAQSGGMLSGLASTVAQGMAFGTGSAIAHRAVGAVAGSFSGSGEQPAEPMAGEQMNNTPMQSMENNACANDKQIYYDCVKDNRDDPAMCNFLLEQLKACQQNQMYSG